MAAIIVLASTLVSVNVKLSKEFKAVTDGFYNGITVNGVKEESIHSQLMVISRAAEDLAAVAERNGIDVSEFRDEISYFNHDVIVMQEYISYIHYMYENILSYIMDVGQKLSAVSLSENDEKIAVSSLEAILRAKDNIEASSYNSTVREYISSLHFPTDFFAEFAGVALPEYFA